ncbi:hypothetical protein KR222_005805 [Zaprionus bogoriensis]|nr:hypothetical protein KR222_005805 [Zaprionus bogoriensis]
MQHTIRTSGDIWFDPSGYYVVALTTLLLCILISLYFANFLSDGAELEDEAADEMRQEDDAQMQAEIRKRLQSEFADDDDDDDDNEVYEEQQQEALSESDAELVAPRRKHNYSHLLGQLKAKQYQQKLEKNLSPTQIEEERRIEREQLAAIFELLRKQEDELNLKDRISDTELKQQVKLYR